jgi:hypothetical protein
LAPFLSGCAARSSSCHVSRGFDAPHTVGNKRAALNAHPLLLLSASIHEHEPFAMADHDVSAFQAKENPSALPHTPGNKISLESGRGTKDNRTPRKFSIARALP